MKIITNYNELNPGDIVAIEYEKDLLTFNAIGEVTSSQRDFVFLVSNGDILPYEKHPNRWSPNKQIKTLALLCPVDEKLHLGDVWENGIGVVRHIVIGEYTGSNTWNAYSDGYETKPVTKAGLINSGYKLRTAPREVTMDEVREKFGEDIIIKKT